MLVVGAGPSGAVVSHTLASRGFNVLCLEQGDWVNSSDYPGNHAEWELLVQERWHHDPNIRKLPSDYPINVTESDMSPVMFNAVGGSTIFFGAEWPRLSPSDFRVKTLDGVADDWPISYRDLTSYHDEVDRFMGVSGLGGDPAFPAGLDYPLPPLPIGKVGRKAAEGCNELGWHWWPGSNAIASHRHKALEPCVRWGTCEWGCPQGAKASADLAYWPHAQSAGAKITTGARVRELVTSPNGLVDGAIWIDRDGNEHLQRADVVVLCCNGVGTPRLLLLSASSNSPDGLANSSGLVGKNLMLHPNCSVAGYYDEDLESHLGQPGNSSTACNSTRLTPHVASDVARSCMFCPFQGRSTRSKVIGIDPTTRSGDNKSTRSRVGIEAACCGRLTLKTYLRRATACRSTTLTDPDGVPAPKVSYRISDNTRNNLRFTVDRMTELHAASGAAETFPVELWIDQPGHLLGTARMGNDPRTSVVNSYGQSHDVPNLYIADGSIFVTSGTANPTATITALALRIGIEIAEQARHQRVPA